MTERQLAVDAPAKVNLYLEVRGRRPDGYHELVTVMQAIDLCDTITLMLRARDDAVDPAASDVRLQLVGASPNGGTTPGDGDVTSAAHVPDDATNLAVRAADAVLRAAGATAEVGVDIRLLKRIPAGGGLGGGSSDAAAVVRGLDELLGEPCGPARRHELCAALGSDVPFFLVGGTALCTGRGEHVLPMDPISAVPITLALPDLSISTAAVYRELAATSTKPRHDDNDDELARLLSLFRDADAASLDALFRNDLEAPARRVLPELDELLLDRGAHLSGSGSTLFRYAAEWPTSASECRFTFIRFVTTRPRNR